MVQPLYSVRSTRDIAYAAGDDAHVRRRLDLYTPQDHEGFPILMFVSGGGWTQGSKAWVGHMGLTLAPLGIGVVTVDHRLIPEVQFDGMVQDLALAFAWVKDNIASYGGDPDQMFVGGHSAGGHITTLLAMDRSYLERQGNTANDIVGIVSVSSTYQIDADYMDSLIEVLGVSDLPGRLSIMKSDDASDRYADLSPINHVRADLPPFFILYAEHELADAIVNQAQLMTKLLEEVQVPVELMEVKGRDHFTIVDFGPADSEIARKLSDWMFKIIQNDSGE